MTFKDLVSSRSTSQPGSRWESTFPWTSKRFELVGLGQEYSPPVRIDSDTGPRLYETPRGTRYPSVTSVFSVLPHPELDAWRDRVGDEEADRVSRVATEHGTRIHAMAESFLRNEFDPSAYNSLMLDAFDPLARVIADKVDRIVSNELMLYSDRMRCAGTTDVIGEWCGKPSIIDFKTSRRIKNKHDIPTYFMQGAAYACMAYELFGIKLPQIVILMLVEDGTIIDFVEKTENHIEKFLEVRNMYRTEHGI